MEEEKNAEVSRLSEMAARLEREKETALKERELISETLKKERSNREEAEKKVFLTI